MTVHVYQRFRGEESVLASTWTVSAIKSRLQARHREAAAARIDAARQAVEQLHIAEPVAWRDVEAVHEREAPQVFRAAASGFGSALGLAVAIFLLYLLLNLQEVRKGSKPSIPQDQVGAVLTAACITSGIAFVSIGITVLLIKYFKLTHGSPPNEADEVVSAALDLLPLLARLSSVDPGRARREALEAVLSSVRSLAVRISYSTRKSGGLRGYHGSQIKLLTHGRRVKAVLTVQTTQLVEDRNEAVKELARLVVHIASAQARCDYGALLPERDLVRGVGPDALEGRVAFRIFGPAAGTGAAVLLLTLVLGGTGSTLFFVPLMVFVVAALISATITGDLHRIRPFVSFIREGGTDPEGALPAGSDTRQPGRRARPQAGPRILGPRLTTRRNSNRPA
ncbi:hypothetical protein [Streptomyces acidicola]|uniref:hypothetical protein n=1 Tax=Streptomyces acidicola TaxID=2596892 RepID=UPI003820C3C2